VWQTWQLTESTEIPLEKQPNLHGERDTCSFRPTAGAEFKPLRTNQLDGRFWASSAIGDDTVILRNSDTLYAVAKTT
jgi:hypothetical protein